MGLREEFCLTFFFSFFFFLSSLLFFFIFIFLNPLDDGVHFYGFLSCEQGKRAGIYVLFWRLCVPGNLTVSKIKNLSLFFYSLCQVSSDLTLGFGQIVSIILHQSSLSIQVKCCWK